MGSFSIWHWLVVLVIVLLFFGAGRLPTVMGDLAKGIKNFKAGMREGERPDEPKPASPSAVLPNSRVEPTAARSGERDEAAHS